MPMTAAQFLALMEPGLNAIWHEAEEPLESVYASVMNVRDMDKQTVRDAKMAGFGPLQRQAEGSDIIFDEAITPVSVSYNYVVDALGYQVTDKLIRDELYDQVDLFERDLNRSAQDTEETFAAAIFNAATATTVATGFDGLALASTAHTRLDGGATQANRPSTLAALSLGALHDGLIQFNKWVNDRGRPFKGTPKTMLIVPDLMLTAAEILESDMRPDTANNAKNVITRFGIKPLVWRYLTGTTFWSLIGDKHDINFLWRFRPETGSYVGFRNNTFERKVRQGYARGFGHWVNYYQGNT